MPFTFAHPAIVLPLAKLNSRFISITALIIGSITPDFECFIRMKAKSNYSHTLWGILYFDIPVSIIIFLIWNGLLKQTLIKNLPAFLQRRFDNRKNNEYKWYAIIISLVIGIFSHLAWDSFTHSDGYFVENIPALHNIYSIGVIDRSLYGLIRDISGVLGAICVIYVLYKLPLKYTTTNGAAWFWPLVAIVVALTITIRCSVPHRILSLGDYFSTFTVNEQENFFGSNAVEFYNL